MNQPTTSKPIVSENEMRGVPDSCLCCKFCKEQDGAMTCKKKGGPISGLDFGCQHWRNSKGQSVFDLQKISSVRKTYRKRKEDDDL